MLQEQREKQKSFQIKGQGGAEDCTEGAEEEDRGGEGQLQEDGGAAATSAGCGGA